jgi:hypothetical protein
MSCQFNIVVVMITKALAIQGFFMFVILSAFKSPAYPTICRFDEQTIKRAS